MAKSDWGGGAASSQPEVSPSGVVGGGVSPHQLLALSVAGGPRGGWGRFPRLVSSVFGSQAQSAPRRDAGGGEDEGRGRPRPWDAAWRRNERKVRRAAGPNPALPLAPQGPPQPLALGRGRALAQCPALWWGSPKPGPKAGKGNPEGRERSPRAASLRGRGTAGHRGQGSGNSPGRESEEMT